MEFYLSDLSVDPPFSAMEDLLIDNDVDRSSWEELVKLWVVDELIKGDFSTSTSEQRSRAVFLAIDLFDLYLSENSSSYEAFEAWPTSPITVPMMDEILSFFLSVLVTCVSDFEPTIRRLLVDPKWDPVIVIKLLDFFPLSLRIQLVPFWGELLIQYLTRSPDKSILDFNGWIAISFFQNIPLHYFKPILSSLMSAIKQNPFNFDASDIFEHILSNICVPREELDFLYLLRDILLQAVGHFDDYDFSVNIYDNDYFFYYLDFCCYFFSHFDLFNTSENNIFDFLGEIVYHCYDSSHSNLFPYDIFELIYPLALSNPEVIPFVPYFVNTVTYHAGFYLSRDERRFFSRFLTPETEQQFLGYLVTFSGYLDKYPENRTLFEGCLSSIPLFSISQIDRTNLSTILPRLNSDFALITLLLSEISFPTSDKILIFEHLTNYDQWLDFLLPRFAYYTNLASEPFTIDSYWPDHINGTISAINFIKCLINS